MNGLEIIAWTLGIVVAFFVSVYPLYYKVGKLEQKVNSLCKLINYGNPKRRRKK